MSLPTLQEYQEAIQRPDLCFKDPDLRKGKTIPGVFGLPKVISGGFAGVFQVKKGKKSYAARCFLRMVDDTKKRYKAIHGFLHRKRIKCVVKFDYIDKGIQAKEKWYPILKMEWLEGETLSEYIEKNRHNRKTMVEMATKFKALVEELHNRGISHGDLHDQNIMVVDGELKVIDYDALYVPKLKGRDCSEIGHTNYQHPERRLSHFGPYIDNFSEWVIYISLKALAQDPEIWDEVEGGDQCLLFRNTDFKDPENSPVFKALNRIEDDYLRLLVDTFKDAVYTYNLEDIPSIIDEDSITRRHRSLVREVVEVPQVGMSGLKVKYTPGDSSWIWDSKEVDYTRFTSASGLVRVTAMLPLIYLIIALVLFVIDKLPSDNRVLITMGAPAIFLLLPASYQINSHVRDRHAKKRELRKLDNKIKALRKRIKQELQTITQFKAEVNNEITKLGDKIASQKNQESIELRKIESNHYSRVAEIEETIKDLKNVEKEAGKTLLKENRERYIVEKLRGHRLGVPGGPNLGLVKGFLLSILGIRSAADFIEINSSKNLFMDNGARFRLRNGGTTTIWWLKLQQIRSLRDWHKKLIKLYEGEAPKKLSSSEKKKISMKYRGLKKSLVEEKKNVKKEIQEEKKKIKESYRAQIDTLKGEIELKKKLHDIEVKKTQSNLDMLCEEINELDWGMNSIKHQLRGYSEISFTNYLRQALTS